MQHLLIPSTNIISLTSPTNIPLTTPEPVEPILHQSIIEIYEHDPILIITPNNNKNKQKIINFIDDLNQPIETPEIFIVVLNELDDYHFYESRHIIKELSLIIREGTGVELWKYYKDFFSIDRDSLAKVEYNRKSLEMVNKIINNFEHCLNLNNINKNIIITRPNFLKTGESLSYTFNQWIHMLINPAIKLLQDHLNYFNKESNKLYFDTSMKMQILQIHNTNKF